MCAGLCADLGSDVLFSLRTSDGSVAGQSTFPPGSGPRHVAVSADGSVVYASCELGNLLVRIITPACCLKTHYNFASDLQVVPYS